MIFSRLSYQDRASHCLSMTAKHLMLLMDEKKTNLAFSADVTTAKELIEYADVLGPEICVLKTHIDIIQDFTPALTAALSSLAKKHRFLIFEDRKFADIGHTVKQQYAGGIYQIAQWADLINAHSLPGPGIIQGLQAGVSDLTKRGLLLLAEMSSSGHLMNAEYQARTLEMAEQFPQFVIGFISQHALSSNPCWIYLTPGINHSNAQDQLSQQYTSPEKAIGEQGSDVIIVGRGILKAKDPLQEAKSYRQAGWDAYCKRMKPSR
jgi:uridine monophosphate synthetase